MTQKSILVFGAGGFIGTYLVDELLRLGYRVTATDVSALGEGYYDSLGVRFVHVDVTKRDDFAKFDGARFDCVIHLAAHQPANVSAAIYDARTYIDVNVTGTLNILEFCRRSAAAKIIYATSHRNTQAMWAEKLARGSAIKESDGRAIKYDGEYAMFSISESAAQDCIEHYSAQYGLRSLTFRLPPVYGYGPHTEIFKDGKPIKTGFQVFIDNALAGKPLEVWGDGGAGRDIVYVKDVVAAFVKGIESDTARGLFNITSGRKLTLREQAETIARLFWRGSNEPAIVERPEKANQIDSFVYDVGKAERELDWRPRYSFEDMLRDYEEEKKSGKFRYLVEKRQAMLKATPSGAPQQLL